MHLTVEQLAARTGESTDALQRYIAAGLLHDEGGFEPLDVERVRLVQLLARRGIDSTMAIETLHARPELLERYVEQLFPDAVLPTITADDVAEEIGLDRALVGRLWDAAGLDQVSDQLTEEDLTSVRALSIAINIGFPEDALVQMLRVYADALNRVGEAEARLFHFYVHERLRSERMEPAELAAATAAATDQLLALIEPTIVFFHRRGLTRAVRDDLVMHLAEDAGLLPPDDETGRLMAAIAFIDLARFTALTEAMGDAAATDILDRFSQMVRSAVMPCGGRVVKQIGDAFMLVFDDAASAVTCALSIRDAALAEPQFLGTRQGLHWGPVLYREGDYYGATVNLAARIVAEASADQVLVSGNLVGAARSLAEIDFVHAGHRSVKHVVKPVEVFDVRRAGEVDDGDGREVDPVCGMTVDATAIEVSVGGRDMRFCSPECVTTYLDDPGSY